MTMKSLLMRCGTIVMALGSVPLMAQSAAAPAGEVPFQSPEARAHVARAMAIAGADLRDDAVRMCRPQPVRAMVGPPPPPGTVVAPPRPRLPREAFAPNRVFDNMWYFGTSEVGATVVRTSRGLVLIDTLTTAEDAQRVLLAGMAGAGLDPAEIRHVIITHAHGDHHGGLALLRSRYPGFHIVMSARDWAFAEQPFYMPDGNPDAAPKAPPRQPGDVSWTGRMELTLGDTVFHLLETPGHTPGTTALVYSVRNGSVRETIAQWGGGSPFDRLFTPASVAQFAALAKAHGATVQWSSHTGPGFWGMASPLGFKDKAAMVRDGIKPNPFVIGRARMDRYLDILTECKQASVLN